jgi:hypothetical protein
MYWMRRGYARFEAVTRCPHLTSPPHIGPAYP